MVHQGHPHATGELGGGARKPERVGVGANEGHGHRGKTFNSFATVQDCTETLASVKARAIKRAWMGNLHV